MQRETGEKQKDRQKNNIEERIIEQREREKEVS